jgi:hypothetical protein
MNKLFLKTGAVIVLLALSLPLTYAQSFITNGLVAYYPFDGNANDLVGTNNGVIYGGVAPAPDRFGSNNSAYTFNGIDGYIDIGSPVGNSPAFLTESAWVNIISRETTAEPVSPPRDVIISKREVQEVIGSGWPELGIVASGPNTGAGIIAVDADFYENNCIGTTLTPTNTWTFICEVCSNGTYQIYINGVLENTLIDTTSLSSVEDMYLMHCGAFGSFCNGVLDDVRIYNRALSSNEVAQLYLYTNQALIQAPIITTQPTNVTVNVGDSASFSVTASGVDSLNYQWFKDGTVIANATNATLTLANVQPPRIGNYTVAITNLGGTTTSTVASLSISNVNSALWQGLIAYYPFNGNANDVEGTNNGTIFGGVVLAPDRFGSSNSAYVFNGVDGYIDIGSPAGNSPVQLTESAWTKLVSRETAALPVSPPFDTVISKRESITGEGWPDLGVVASGPSTGAGIIALDADFYFNPCIGTSLTPINDWVFICEVCSNGTYQIYMNGFLENTITDSHPLSSTNKMYLMHCGAFSSYCNGALDDVRIYNRALSSSDIAQLYASEAPPHMATGTATLAAAFVIGVNIIDSGAGYTNTPLVHLIGGGGSGAQAVAVVVNGVVTAINVINAGYGYTNAPQVVIDPPFVPSPALSIAPMSFLTFSNVTVGGHYQLQQFQSYYWANQSVSFTASNTVYTQMVSGVVGNEDYRLALAPAPVQAFATPQVVNGFIVGATVTAGGSGYVTTPAVTISGDVGTNATAMASINGGVVTSVTIISAGMGYTNQVAIQIDPPPAAAVPLGLVQPVMRVDSANLAPYYNYQIQFEPDIAGMWVNWNGGSFFPNNVTNSQFLFITNDIGFFRLQYLP